MWKFIIDLHTKAKCIYVSLISTHQHTNQGYLQKKNNNVKLELEEKKQTLEEKQCKHWNAWLKEEIDSQRSHIQVQKANIYGHKGSTYRLR